MTDPCRTRPTQAADALALVALYRSAFAQEDLAPLVQRLLHEEPQVLSLAAIAGGALIGHVLFSPCAVGDRSDWVSLLGPLAVAPSWQRRGVGSALVREGLHRLAAMDFARVVVLGDPRYYRRFGFTPQCAITPPYALPPAWKDAWQGRDLGEPAPGLIGPLRPPAAWLIPALWAP